MAKYLSYKNIDGEKSFYKLHSSDESKTWWSGKEADLNFITLTDDDYNKVKIMHPWRINASNQLEFSVLDENSPPVDLDKDTVQKGLNSHINAMENHLRNHESPLIAQTNIDTLRNINLENISWPASSTLNSWVEVLENNSNSIDFMFEV